MRLTLTINNLSSSEQDSVLTLDMFPDMTLSTLRESIQAEAGVAPDVQRIYHNGRELTNNDQTMEQLQIQDGDMLAVHVMNKRVQPVPQQPQQRRTGGVAAPAQQQQQQQRQRPPGETDAEFIRLQILGDPNMRAQISSQQPELASALENPEQFSRLLNAMRDRDQGERMRRQREIQRLNEDPFDVDNQRRIEEMIREEQVMENLQSAMEHNPEVFGRVHMLYVNVEVNGNKVQALVDSGAQATIMSPAAAEACGIMRLVDKRFSGVAKGVGTANIIGRVHSAPMKIGGLYLPCSFTVMEGKNVDLLFGLDMLKRFQATIDLARDKLCIQVAEQRAEIPFLGESEIPKEEEATVPGPSGTSIGQQTGALHPPAEGSQQPSSTSHESSQQTAPPAREQQPEHRSGAVQAEGAPPSSTSATGSGQGASSEGVNVTPAHIDSLMSMGATRAQAIQALQVSEDNVEVAAGLIFF